MSVILPAAEIPGAAQESTSQDILAAVDGLESGVAALATEATATGIESQLTTLNDVDFATETTLASVATGVSGIITRLNEMASGLVTVKHDSIYPTFNATSDVWEYKASGSTVATVTVNYSDSTKAVITSIVRT